MWQTRMSDILVDMNLFSYVDGSLPVPMLCPGSEESKATLDRWKEDDRMALSQIRLRVARPVFLHLVSAMTSKEAWDEIASRFSPTPLTIILVRRKLYRHTINEGADVGNHIRLLCKYQAELTAFGAAESDTNFALTLLAALPASWDQFCADAIYNDYLEAKGLVGRILAEADRRKSRPPKIKSTGRRRGRGLR